MAEVLDGVQLELGPAIPVKTKVTLNAFRKRLHKPLIVRRRKRFEQELEAFLQSDRALRAAAEGYISKKLPPVIEAAVATLKRAAQLLVKNKMKGSASKATK